MVQIETPIARRVWQLIGFALALIAFRYGPDVLQLQQAGRMYWAAAAQLGGPLIATVLCFLAARRSVESDRSAWMTFGAGSLLYLAANAAYLVLGLAEIAMPFPTVVEAAYFVMAIFFAVGMSRYGNVNKAITRVQFYNFVLVYCAIVVACLFVLHEDIKQSVMAPFGTILAYLYPALWLSVAAFGIIAVVLYDQGERSFTFFLLLAAVIAEAVADFIYARALLDGSYQLGGITQLLWVASATFIAWAALDHMLMQRGGSLRIGVRRRSDFDLTQAAIPALAIAIFMLAASTSGAFGRGAVYMIFSSAIGIVFALVAGLREHRIMSVQQELRTVAEGRNAEIIEARRRLLSVLESTSDSVLLINRAFEIEFFNEKASEILAPIGKLTLGASLWEAFPLRESSSCGNRLRVAMQSGHALDYEEFIEPQAIWLAINAYPTPGGLSIFFRDISEHRLAREQIEFMAHHDSLTGLVNRDVFRNVLEQAAGGPALVAILLLDLDNFKDVNDTLGHAVGDAVLTETAERLRRCSRPSDTVARIEGDEFVIIVTGAEGPPDVEKMAQHVLDAVGAAHVVNGQSISVGASIGVALAGTDLDPVQMQHHADIALNCAKAGGKGLYRFFEPEMEVSIQERKALIADLAVAADNGEFEVFYQPIMNFRSGRVSSFEALLRWRHPVRGIVSPEIFIPLAEETGHIVEIGRWVLNEACAVAATLPSSISIAINLSTRQFADNSLLANVETVLTATGLAPERLELEVTETALLNDNESNLRTLLGLREMGIRVALDDFGTGYSSLTYLQKFRFSKLKIDRSFVSGLPGNEESKAIVRAVVGLGKSLGMRITAEGVETVDQYEFLKAECDEAQGYLFSHPVPASQIPATLRKLNASSPFAACDATRHLVSNYAIARK